MPRLVFVLFGGVLVDRRGPRELMIHSDVLRAAVAFAAAAIALWQPSVVLLIIVAIVFGTADAVFLPAASALQPLSSNRRSTPVATRRPPSPTAPR